MEKDKLIKLLKPNYIGYYIKLVIVVIAFVLPLPLIFAAFCEYIYQKDWVTFAVVGVIMIFVYVLFARMAIKNFKNSKRILDKRSRTFCELTSYDLEKLTEQINSGEFYFKTMYLLDEYIFVPKPGLLLRYSDIWQYKTEFHSTNSIPDAVYVRILDTDNITHTITVKKWRDYKNNYNVFMDLLDRKGAFKNFKTAENQDHI